jgi:RNA polymerase sigma-70 factor (ECF subfamily)
MNTDPQTEKRLVEQYAGYIHGWLLKCCGNPQLACDLAQDTFIVAIRKLRSGEVHHPESMTCFLRQTAKFLLFAHYRKERRYISGSDDTIAGLDSGAGCVGETIDRSHTNEMLKQAMTRLPVERDRDILRRYYLFEQDKPVICGDLELSSAHFDRVLHRARRRLAALLDCQAGLFEAFSTRMNTSPLAGG